MWGDIAIALVGSEGSTETKAIAAKDTFSAQTRGGAERAWMPVASRMRVSRVVDRRGLAEGLFAQSWANPEAVGRLGYIQPIRPPCVPVLTFAILFTSRRHSRKGVNRMRASEYPLGSRV